MHCISYLYTRNFHLENTSTFIDFPYHAYIKCSTFLTLDVFFVSYRPQVRKCMTFLSQLRWLWKVNSEGNFVLMLIFLFYCFWWPAIRLEFFWILYNCYSIQFSHNHVIIDHLSFATCAECYLLWIWFFLIKWDDDHAIYFSNTIEADQKSTGKISLCKRSLNDLWILLYLCLFKTQYICQY
jgi:hypothetical protein